MAKLCIPSLTVEKMKEALLSGKLSLAGLYNMPSSEARQAKFAEFLPKELAKFVNTKFEQAAASRSKNALTDFVKSLTTEGEADSKKTKNLLTKIAALEDAGLINTDEQTATFTDLVSDRLGVSVSAEEIKVISEKAKEIEVLNTAAAKAEIDGRKETDAKKWSKDLGKAIISWKTAVKDMDKYMNSLTPVHNLAVLTGSLGRGNMLLNIPVGTINTISNEVQSIFKALERRIVLRQLTGSNNAFAVEYAKMVLKVFHKTGFDISRNYAEDIRLGEHLTHNEGPGIIRKVARGQAKIVFKYILGYSDVAYAAMARSDYSNLGSSKIAAMRKGFTEAQNKEYAQQVFKESVRTTASDVTTQLGQDGFMVNSEAIAEAESSTWTDKRFLAEKAIGLRNWLNDLTGDLQLGFWTIPFIKTGTNVVQFGLEASPIGGIPAFFKVRAAIKAMNDPVMNEKDKREATQDAWRSAARAGLGTLLSYILVSLIPPDDFFSAYDSVTQAQRDQMGLKKGVYNAVKIGKTWVSLDFFGPLAPSIVGFLYAKKYGQGKGITEKVFKFAQGAGQQTLQVPGMDSFEDLVEGWRDLLTAETKEEAGKAAAISVFNTIRSRAIPGIFGTLAKATDIKVRKIDRTKFFDRFKAGIPGLRQTLQPKIDITTGKEVKGEGFLINLFFGSRVKTANESALIDEISRLETKGFSPAIADIERSSKKVQGLKIQLGADRFQAALKFFGREYGKKATRLIRSNVYRRASDEGKKKLLNALRTKVRSEMLERFNFRKPKKRGRK